MCTRLHISTRQLDQDVLLIVAWLIVTRRMVSYKPLFHACGRSVLIRIATLLSPSLFLHLSSWCRFVALTRRDLRDDRFWAILRNELSPIISTIESSRSSGLSNEMQINCKSTVQGLTMKIYENQTLAPSAIKIIYENRIESRGNVLNVARNAWEEDFLNKGRFMKEKSTLARARCSVLQLGEFISSPLWRVEFSH